MNFAFIFLLIIFVISSFTCIYYASQTDKYKKSLEVCLSELETREEILSEEMEELRSMVRSLRDNNQRLTSELQERIDEVYKNKRIYESRIQLFKRSVSRLKEIEHSYNEIMEKKQVIDKEKSDDFNQIEHLF